MKIPAIEYLNKVKLERSRHYKPPQNPLRKEKRLDSTDMKGWQQSDRE
ncbi:MAG TPA: hypothetical protein VJG30_04785 [Candidatus Nanoarchaeia archaeon]|nr:hypothetical protein [Candidatus Nanoarchaeia archaeon]